MNTPQYFFSQFLVLCPLYLKILIYKMKLIFKMKQIFICLFSLSAFYIFGQPTTVKKLSSGGVLEAKFVISHPNDTSSALFFYPNGLTKDRFWGHDSVYHYNLLGQLQSKYFFGTHKYYIQSLNIDSLIQFDSLILFRNDGSPTSSLKYASNGSLQIFHYSKKGQLEEIQNIDTFKNRKLSLPIFSSSGKSTEIFFSVDQEASKYYYYTSSDGNGIKKTAQRFSALGVLDSTFYPDGRLKTIAKNNKTHWVASQKTRADGSIEAQFIYPDKDNISCLYGFRNNQDEWIAPPQYVEIQRVYQHYFIIDNGQKKGVIDMTQKTIIPFEYDAIRVVYEEEGHINKGPLFQVTKNKQTGILNEKSEWILPLQNALGDIRFESPHFFTFYRQFGTNVLLDKMADTVLSYKGYYISSISDNVKFAVIHQDMKNSLIDLKGNILLPITYEYIRPIKPQSLIYKVDTQSNRGKYIYNVGYFHAEKGWLLKPQYKTHYLKPYYRALGNDLSFIDAILSVEINGHNKYGLCDSLMNVLLPFEYDSLVGYWLTVGIEQKPIEYVWVKKQEQQGLYDRLKKKWIIPLQNDSIQIIVMNNYNKGYSDYIFYYATDRYRETMCYKTDIIILKKNKNKWHIFNKSDMPSMKGTFDDFGKYEYGTYFLNMENFKYEGSVVYYFVQKNKVFLINQEQFPKKVSPQVIIDSNRLFVNLNKKYIINKTGKIIVPPQYTIVVEADSGLVIQHKITKSQSIILPDGAVKPIVFKDKIIDWEAKTNYFIIEDSSRLLGVVDANGKTILPCKYYYIVRPNPYSQTIWAKSVDIRPNKDYNLDWSLRNYDNDAKHYIEQSKMPFYQWQMYDFKGHLLSEKSFDYPFWTGKNDITVCTHGEVQSVWYNNKVLIDADYSGVALSNKHFFLETDKGHAIVDTLGNILHIENADAIIPINERFFLTQNRSNDIQVRRFNGQTYAYQDDIDNGIPLLDSLEESQIYQSIKLPLSKLQDLPEGHRHRVSNFVISNLASRHRIDFQKLDEYLTRYPFFESSLIEKDKPYTVNIPSENMNDYELKIGQIYAYNYTQNSVSFAAYISKNEFFQTFIKKKDQWQALSSLFPDVLNNDNTTKAALNALIIKKIQALKNINIDCSNPDAWLKNIGDKFFIDKNGIRFWLLNNDYYSSSYHWHYIDILISWEELAPLESKIIPFAFFMQ